MKLEQVQALLFERDRQILQLEKERQKNEKVLAELSARKAYLDKK